MKYASLLVVFTLSMSSISFAKQSHAEELQGIVDDQNQSLTGYNNNPESNVLVEFREPDTIAVVGVSGSFSYRTICQATYDTQYDQIYLTCGGGKNLTNNYNRLK